MAVNRLQKFDIDAALDCVDLTFPGYVPSQDAFEFFNLIRVFFGEDFEVPNPIFHYFIIDMLYGNVKLEDFPYSQEIIDTITIDPHKIGIISTRGSAKSTIASFFYPIVAAIKGRLPVTGPLSHILVLSDSQQGGARDQARIMGNAFQKSAFAKEWFEDVRCTDAEIELVRRGTEPLEKRHMLIKFKGAASGGIRSGSRNPVTGDRYALIIADDVIKNEADAYSETIMHNVTTALMSDARNAMRAKNTQYVLINTPFHKLDPIYMMVESGGYTPLVTPICKKIYIGMPEEEFVALWDDMHSFESVMSRYLEAVATNTTRSFNQELMLRVSNDEDRLVTDDMIQWYDRALIMKLLDGYTLYITTDFTTTSAAKSDFSVIAAWAINSEDDWFLLDLCVRRQELQQQYDELMRMVRTWSRGGRAVEVGVEIDGQQKAHIFSIKERMMKDALFFGFAKQKGAPIGREGILSRSGNTSKIDRFRYIVPRFQNHKIYFPEQLKNNTDMLEGLKQLKGATHAGFSTHDDFPDVITQLGLIDLRVPTMNVEDLDNEVNGFIMSDGEIYWNEEKRGNDYGGSTVF